MSEHDVLIVGLGPVGSTAANIAGAFGLDCVGVDLSTEVFGLPRAIHFDAEIMRIFQSVGLADEVLEIVRVGRGSVHLGADGKPIRDFRVSGERGDLGWSPHYMFYQPQLDQLLRDRAGDRASVELMLGFRCLQVAQDPDGVVATVESAAGEKREVRARYLVACDGATSTVRRQLGIEFFDYGFEEPWVVVDMQIPGDVPGPDYIVTHCNPERPIVYVPGPGRHRRWEYMILPDEDPHQLTDPAAIRSVIAPGSPWLDIERTELIRSAIYTFHGLVARKWEEQRILLAGDAAHQTPPFYAQGMCHGIRDVNGLLWKLAMVLRDQADPALLQTYQAEREPHVRSIIEAAVNNGRYICMLDPEEARRRDASFRVRMRDKSDIGSFRGIIPGLAGGLLDDASATGDGIGRLMPQPPVRDQSGRTRRLDDCVGLNFAAVTLGDPRVLIDDWFVTELNGQVISIADGTGGRAGIGVSDEAGVLADWLRKHGAEWAVIRPDRYVFGFAADQREVTALTRRLREMLHGERRPSMTLVPASK